MKTSLVRLFVVLVLITGVVLAIVFRDHLDAATLAQWLDGTGSAAPILFMGLYAVGTVFFLPGSVLTLAGGAFFGPVWGTVYNLSGATLGALLAFLVARYLASDWVEKRAGGRLNQLKQGVEKEGWRFVALVRLVPIFPFNLLNYALGLTRIRVAHYVLATYICMLPGAIAFTYLGYAGREAVVGGEGMIQKGLTALSLLAIAAFLPRLIGHFRRKPMLTVASLKEKLDRGEDILVLDVRTAEEFTGEQGHIRGAANIPVEQLLKRHDELADHLERPIAIVCRTDHRSVKAARILARYGYADFHVIQGGMTLWNEAGYQTEA